jgi:hypothetical protein
MMLKDMKELKREYRENYSQLKTFKQELKSLQENIDASKDQLIYQFETWYDSEFELFPNQQPPRELDMNKIDAERAALKSGSLTGSAGGSQKWNFKNDEMEDDDAIIYRKAKESVDELRRARKFEKSIKIK